MVYIGTVNNSNWDWHALICLMYTKEVGDCVSKL